MGPSPARRAPPIGGARSECSAGSEDERSAGDGRPVENEEANMRHASVVPWLVLLLASPAARARGARPPVGGGPGPLVCAVPDGQPPGAALPVRCGTDARARPKTVTLHYRSSG